MPQAPAGGAASAEHRPEYRWAVLIMAFMGVFGALGLGRFGYSAVLPAMQKGLHISSAAALLLPRSADYRDYVRVDLPELPYRLR